MRKPKCNLVMMCLDGSPEQVLLHAVTGGVGVADTLHRQGPYPSLRVQLKRWKGGWQE